MKKDNAVYLKDILQAIKKIDGYVKNINFTTFSKEDMRHDAIIRQLEIIGEAVNRLSKDFLQRKILNFR